MVQPIDLQLAHFNVERSAQMSKDALAAAQQTGQGKEVVEESVRRAQMVQAAIAAAEPKKVKRKEEEESRERRRERQDEFFRARDDLPEESSKPTEAKNEELESGRRPKNFDLYA